MLFRSLAVDVDSANRDHGLLFRWLLRSVSPNSDYVSVLGEGLIVSPEECNIDFQCTIVYPRTVYVFNIVFM